MQQKIITILHTGLTPFPHCSSTRSPPPLETLLVRVIDAVIVRHLFSTLQGAFPRLSLKWVNAFHSTWNDMYRNAISLLTRASTF